jgi:hypothetical protein
MGVGGTDEAIVGNVHELPQIQNALLTGNDVIYKLLGGDTGFLGTGLDLLTVLVGAGEEKYIIATESLIPSHSISGYGAVGMTDVQLVGGVVNGGGDKKFLTGITHAVCLLSLFFTNCHNGPENQDTYQGACQVDPNIQKLTAATVYINLQSFVGNGGEEAEQKGLGNLEVLGVKEHTQGAAAQNEVLCKVSDLSQKIMGELRPEVVQNCQQALALGSTDLCGQRGLEENEAHPKGGANEPETKFWIFHK